MSGNIPVELQQVEKVTYPSVSTTPVGYRRNVFDASRLIENSLCSVGNKSEFIITERGGLPSAPNDTLSATAPWEDWSLAEIQTDDLAHSSQPAVVSQPLPTSQPLVEAKRWSKTPSGQIMLYAAAPTTAQTPSPQCRQLQQQLQSTSP